eukprot:16842_5
MDFFKLSKMRRPSSTPTTLCSIPSLSLFAVMVACRRVFPTRALPSLPTRALTTSSSSTIPTTPWTRWLSTPSLRTPPRLV